MRRVASADELRRGLEEDGLEVDATPWYPDAFRLRSGSLRDLERTRAWGAGWLYVQDLASMVPPLALDPRPGDRVLDIAAAPGSKTTQIACLMRGEGTILANDRSRSRAFRLRAVLEAHGARCVKLSSRPGESFARTHREAFDRVLVDAPCSGEGRFRPDRPETWKDWSLGKVRRCARVQSRLLRAGAEALRPGGILVYSTCTFAPEENEAVVEGALDAWPGDLEMEEIAVPIDGAAARARRPGLDSVG